MQNRQLSSWAIWAIFSMIFLISCQPSLQSTPIAMDNEVKDFRVQMVEPVRAISRVESFPLPNCGGTDRLVQSLGTYASASKSATVSGKATVTGGGEVGIPETTKLKLEIQVELAYQQMFESANSRIDSIEMAAAKESHVVYTIIWEDQTFQSVVRYSADNDVYEVPYTYRLSVPKIDTSYNVQCNGNSVVNGNGGSIEPPPVSGPSSGDSPPPPVLKCPSVVSRQLIEQWAQIGGTSKSTAQNSINDFDRMRVGGEYKIGDVLPAGVAIVTDFGNGESDIYLTLPVRAIAHYHSWGVFEVTSEYEAIQTGSCMTIIP